MEKITNQEGKINSSKRKSDETKKLIKDILDGKTKITFNFVSYDTPQGKEELKQIKKAQQESLDRKKVDRNELNKFRCEI